MRVVLWVVALVLGVTTVKAVSDQAPVTTIFILVSCFAAIALVLAKQMSIDDSHRKMASLNAETRWRCGTCSAEFDNEIEFNDHELGLDEPVNFSCDCGLMTTFSRREMFAHVASHRGEDVVALVEERLAEPHSNNFHDELLKCEGCDFVTHFETQLLEHQVSHTAKVE